MNRISKNDFRIFKKAYKRQHYIVKQNIPAETFIFSVPDYFTCIHKDYFMNIIRASGFTNNVHLINESTAITLYYGYKNYHDYFVVKNISDSDPTKKGVDPTVVKYVIFINAGYSKTSFILSKLTHNVFTVLDSFTIPFFGGGNFNDAIYKMCVQKFKEQTGIDISKNKVIRKFKDLTISLNMKYEKEVIMFIYENIVEMLLFR